MTQEEKQLLLQDLCARLPYGVIVEASYKDGDGWKTEDRKLLGIYEDGQVYVDAVYADIKDIKPYLRQMSSMTEEEEREVIILWNEDFADKVSLYHCYPKTTDFYNAHHFDYRGLIEKGLAFEAPEGMYKIE